MKINIVKGMSAVLIGGLVLGCGTKNDQAKEETTATVAVDKEQVKKEIQAKEDEFERVYNSGVVKNIGYFADDATSYFQNREPLVGKQAILEFLYSDLRTKSDSIDFSTNEVFVSNDGNMVLEIGSFRVVDSVGMLLNSGNYMTLFEKRDGKYVAVRDMSASDGRFNK